jgi:tRNA pseudouridine55 synthase
MNGVLNIDKPAGMTSHDVVARIRRLAHLKRVGHAGTLDPDATGVLLVCLGAATRIAEYLTDEGKSYRATLALGATTTTEDASGEIIDSCDALHITAEDLQRALPQFVGDIRQVPPMVSAVHHEGRRLYELARQGVTVEREPRTIHIDALRLVAFSPGARPTAILDVDCGKGTYIRTLCTDLGAAVGVGGHMATLRRTRVGAFSEATATPLGNLAEGGIADVLVTASEALSRFPTHLIFGPDQEDDIRHGRSLATVLDSAPVVRIVDAEDRLLALGRAESGCLLPFKVFL